MAMILRYVYILVVIIILLYCLLKKRRIDFVLVYFLSSLLFFFPLLLGEFQAFVFRENDYVYTPQAIDYRAYIVLISNSLICWIWILCKDYYARNKKADKTSGFFKLNDYQNIIILFLEIIFFVVNLYLSYRLRGFIFTKKFDKTALLQNTTVIDTIALNVTYFLFVVAFSFQMRWGKITKILAIVLLVYPILMAKRSEVVMGIVAIIFIWTTKQKYSSLWDLMKQNRWLIIGGGIFLISVFWSKAILNYVIQGEWDVVLQYLRQKGSLKSSFIYSEPNVITSNLNEILRLRVDAEGDSYRFSLLGFVPFIGTLSEELLVPKDFYQIYQPIVYPMLQGWGTASCFLAEAVSNGGWLMLFCAVNGVCAAITLIEQYLYKGKNMILKCGLLAAAPYLMFYIHRNSLYFTIRCVRFFLYLAIGLNVVYVLLCINKSGKDYSQSSIFPYSD